MELSTWQVELLAAIPALVENGGEALPADAYADDPLANSEYRRYMADEAEQADSGDMAIVMTTLSAALDGVVLDAEEAEAWLRSVGKARLVLGDRLGVTSNAWEADDTMEESPELALLHYLSWIQNSLVDALSDVLPDPVE
jgi:hypothetical protein